MFTSIKNKKLLYHLAALKNMESILKDGLKPRSLLSSFKDVAEQDIINFRNQNGISDCIPFHFFKGTPFAGAVQKRYPEEEFVYITIHRNIARKYNFKIIPMHPIHMNPFQLFDFNEGMEEINWDLMDKRDYSIYECKEVCMAECIAPYKKVSVKFFHSIIVKSNQTKIYLENLYKDIFSCKPNFFIDIEPESFVGL